MTAALEGGEWSAARPGRTLPPEKTRYPFYSRLGGPQGPSGLAENLVPTGIRSRTVQHIAQSLYRLNYPAHTRFACHLKYMFAPAMQVGVFVLLNGINTLGVDFKHHSILHMLCNNPIIAYCMF